MRRFVKPAVALILGLGVIGASRTAYADAFDPHQVPADSKWALHVDVDALRAGKTWDVVDKKLASIPGAHDKIAEVRQITGLDFPKGLHDVTLWGCEAGDEAGVIIVHADVDKERLTGIVSLARDHAVNNYRDYEIHSWTDKDKQMFGAIAPNGLTILGRLEKNVQKALDTIDGNVESIKPDSVRNAGNKAGVLVYAAGQKIKDLKVNNPFVGQIDAAWASISEEGDNVVVCATVTAKTAEAATQMRSGIEGIKALLGLATADSATSDSKAALAAKLLKGMTSRAEGTSVTVSVPVSLEQLRDLVQNGLGGENRHDTTEAKEIK